MVLKGFLVFTSLIEIDNFFDLPSAASNSDGLVLCDDCLFNYLYQICPSWDDFLNKSGDPVKSVQLMFI